MATAKRLPSGNWRVRLYVGKKPDGTREYMSFTDPDKKTAEYMAAEYAMKRNEKAKPLNMTVGEAIDRYIDTKTNVLSPSSVDSYKSVRRNAFAGLMPIKLADLTNDLIQVAVNTEAAAHAPKTVRTRFGLLTSALAEYHPGFTPRVKLPKKVKTEITIPEHDRVSQLMNAVRGTPVEIPVVLASCLGLRRSEICALTWDDYDDKKRKLRINKAVVLNEDNLWVVKSPKSFAGSRVLDVPPSVCTLLDSAQAAGAPIALTNPNIMSHKYNRIIKKLGVAIRFHDLRHYYASVLLAIGIPDKYAMQRMGHATPDMLKTVYQHTLRTKDEEVTATINGHMDNIMSLMHHEI